MHGFERWPLVCLLLAGAALVPTAGWTYSRSLLESSEIISNEDVFQVAEAPVSETPAAAVSPAAVYVDKRSPKNSGVAITWALGPGFLVHGAGHMYAGRPWTGVSLFLAEVGGAYMAYRGGTDAYSAIDVMSKNNFAEFHGDSGQVSRGIGLAAGGVMIFLASWLYDLTGSPIAVDQYNQTLTPRQAETSSPVIVTQLTPGGVTVAVEQRF